MATVLQFDEINALAQEIYNRTEFLPKERRKKEITDEIEDLLVIAYVFGEDRVLEAVQSVPDLPDRILPEEWENPDLTKEEVAEGLKPDAQSLYDTVYKPIAGKDFAKRIADRIDEETLDLPALQRIAETEYHRCEETGAYDTAKKTEKKTSLRGFKVWNTMLDERVRATHEYLEADEVGLDEHFVTFDGDMARYPGDFSDPENNIGCRCSLSYTFR